MEYFTQNIIVIVIKEYNNIIMRLYITYIFIGIYIFFFIDKYVYFYLRNILQNRQKKKNNNNNLLYTDGLLNFFKSKFLIHLLELRKIINNIVLLDCSTLH